MKRAFTRWYNYLLGIGLAIIPVAIALILYFNGKDNEALVWPFEYNRYTLFFSAIIFVAVGFIWQDLYRAFNRHKTNNWDNPLPEQIVDNAWAIFAPFLIGAALALITGVIFSIPGVTF